MAAHGPSPTVSANFTRKPQLSASIIPPKTEGSDEGGRNMSCGYKFGLDTEVFHCLNEWMTHDTYYFSGTNIQLNAELGTDGYEFLESNNRQSCNGGTWAPNAVCSFIMSGPKTYSAYALFSLKPLLNVVFTPTDGGTLHHADVVTKVTMMLVRLPVMKVMWMLAMSRLMMKTMQVKVMRATRTRKHGQPLIIRRVPVRMKT